MAANRVPPQPHPSRLTEFAGHPLVVGVVPGQPALVALTAAALGRATNAPALHFAYVDPERYVDQELPDGTVRHRPIDPDLADDDWQTRESVLTAEVADALGRSLDGSAVAWDLRYLAGRVDRSLTHLARAVDAAAFVVGTHTTRRPIHDFLTASLATQLAHRQHRPVLTVPLEVVDWEAAAPWE